LLGEIGKTGLHLGRCRWTISGAAARHIRPALEDVRDVNVGAGEPHCRNNFREKLSGPADERFAPRVFIGPGRFPDEHHFRVGIANAEDCLGPRRGQMRALHANGDAGLNGREERSLI
jgi:hypothetical protein